MRMADHKRRLHEMIDTIKGNLQGVEEPGVDDVLEELEKYIDENL